MKKSSQNGQGALTKSSIQRQRKIKNNTEEIAYLEAVTTIGEMVIEARKKQDSVKLKQMAKAIQDIALYVNSLHMERENLYLNI